MVTKNFKSLVSNELQAGSREHGGLAVRDVAGRRWYVSNYVPNGAFPYSKTDSATLNAASAGISVGTGGSAATEEDYKLEEPITDGVTLSVSNTSHGCDAPGCPYVSYRLTVTNTSLTTVTVREIGYKQTLRCCRIPGPSGNAVDNRVCLLDRTVLPTPVEIEPEGVGIIDYKLRTDASAPRVVSGVEVVGWEYGSDAQIAAMLDAAHNGTINLQEDARWRVGDLRLVELGAFTDGSGASHAAQRIALVISGFTDDYDCGCVMQFDFLDALALGARMNAAATNAGGYGASEMKTATLPALANALPDWLKSRLLTFDVLASAGGGSSVIETVTGNKLALRAEVELRGATSYSYSGEGEQRALYQESMYKTRRRGLNGSSGTYWLRSPGRGDQSSTFVLVDSSGVPKSSATAATTACGVAPFGCV